MKRLYLTVEGQTEAEFAMSVLRPHLASFNVFLLAPRFTGPHGRRQGRIPRGGLLQKFQYALGDIERWLKEDQSAEARFSMMIDLYHLPHDFPGYDEGMSRLSGREQAAALERSLAEVLGDTRFVPYLQVHEFEALVLSEPQRIASLYEVRASDLEALCTNAEPSIRRKTLTTASIHIPSIAFNGMYRRMMRTSPDRFCVGASALRLCGNVACILASGSQRWND
jgi:hypothetical protein